MAGSSEANPVIPGPQGSRPEPFWITSVRRSLSYGQTRTGLGLMAGVLVVVFLGPLVAPHEPTALVGSPFAVPSSSNLLGTDYLGEDVLSRLLNGGLTVLWMSLAATVLGVGLGVVGGLAAGYAGRRVDAVLMVVCDVLLAFPGVIVILLFVSILGPKLWLIVLVTALTHAPRVTRQTRGITMEVIEREYVQAVRLFGMKPRRILAGEVLPNIITPISVEFGLRLSWSIATIAAISFLGFGVQAPQADWGLMVNENKAGLVLNPWGVLAPVICISAFALGANLIAEGFSRSVARIDMEGKAS